MIFHAYILQHGCSELLKHPEGIPDEFVRFLPQYKKIIFQYESDYYWQHLQLYLSTLKDFEMNRELK